MTPSSPKWHSLTLLHWLEQVTQPPSPSEWDEEGSPTTGPEGGGNQLGYWSCTNDCHTLEAKMSSFCPLGEGSPAHRLRKQIRPSSSQPSYRHPQSSPWAQPSTKA